MDASTLTSIKNVFHSMKKSADGALAQVSLDELLFAPGPEVNSIAVTIQHLHGNMLSRWTDFLTSDGEKATRNRDGEFETPRQATRDSILDLWESGWRCTFSAIDALQPGDLDRTITIRGQAHTVVEALHRQIFHYGYHIGQIVTLAKMQRGANWKTLSIARGRSKEYAPKGAHGEPPVK